MQPNIQLAQENRDPNYVGPLPILRIENNTVILNIDNLHKYASKFNPGIRICVLPMVGGFREGKSFALNFIIKYLQFYKDRPICRTPIGEIGEWLPASGGDEGVTKGIDFWSEPLLVKYPNGQQVYIVLMDCQGMFDNEQGRNAEKALIGITALIADVLIFNINSRLNEMSSNCLASLMQFAQAFNQEKDSNYSKTGLLLIRNYQNYSNPDNISQSFQEGCQYWKDYQRRTHQEERKHIQECLTNAFTSVESRCLPHPGSEVTYPRYNGQISKICPIFLKQMTVFVEDLIFSIVPSVSNRNKMTSKEFEHSLIRICDTFKDLNRLPSVHDIRTIQTVKDLYSFSKSLSLVARQKLYDFFYCRTFSDKCSNQFSQSTLNEKRSRVLKEADDNFNAKYPRKDDLIVSENKRVHADVEQYFSTILEANRTLEPKYNVVRRNMFHKDRRWEYPKLSHIPNRPSE